MLSQMASFQCGGAAVIFPGGGGGLNAAAMNMGRRDLFDMVFSFPLGKRPGGIADLPGSSVSNLFEESPSCFPWLQRARAHSARSSPPPAPAPAPTVPGAPLRPSPQCRERPFASARAHSAGSAPPPAPAPAPTLTSSSPFPLNELHRRFERARRGEKETDGCLLHAPSWD